MAVKRAKKKKGTAREIGAKIGAEIDTELAKKHGDKDCKWGDDWGKKSSGNSAGFMYFLGIVASAVYYIQNADSFRMGALGILKAFVWPAMVVYKILGF